MIISMPPVVVIETTSKCNMRCLMCPQDKQIEVGDIDISLVNVISAQISEYAQYIQLYLVGEPTLHPNLINIIRKLRQDTNAFLEISTNLSVFERHSEWEALLNSGINRVLCCIEGATASSYVALRQTGNFEKAVAAVKTMANIKMKHNLNIDLVVKSIGTAYNKEEQNYFNQFWNFIPGVRTVNSWLNTWAGSLPSLGKIGLKGGPNANLKREPCAELWNKMIIRWNGKLVLCCHDWKSEHIIGDATMGSLYDIWTGLKLLDARREHLARHFTGICETCKEWSKPEEYALDYDIDMSHVTHPGV